MSDPAAADLPHILESPSTTPAIARIAPGRLIAATIAAVAIGLAIQIQDGEYTPAAIRLITIALLAAIAIFLPWPARWRERLRAGDRAAIACAAIGLLIQFIVLWTIWPLSVDQRAAGPEEHQWFLGFTSFAALLIALGISRLRWTRDAWFPMLLAVHLLLGFWMIRVSPSPHIDVWVFQQQGPDALLHGRNPYDYRQARFPDIYHSTRPGAQEVYGPGMSVNGRLRFGFPYPPASLLLATGGYAAAGDHRYAQAVALTLAGLLIGYARPGRLAKLAAALLIFTPRELFVLGRGWTEPFVAMLLAATVFCACRRLWRWMLPVALGVFLASKQYLALAVPFTFLLCGGGFHWRQRDSWRAWAVLLIKAAIVAAIVTLPLALGNWHAFWFSTVTVQQKAPFRWDALSYMVSLAFANSRYITWRWLMVGLLLTALGGAFAMALLTALRRGSRQAEGPFWFAASIGLVFLVFFAFNKQAFCNYYFFTIAAFCCAIAAGAAPDELRSPSGNGDSALKTDYTSQH